MIGMVEVAFALPVNVALTGTATANSEYLAITAASKAIDNDVNTGWNAGDHGAFSDPNWLVIDLGNVFSISKIDIIYDVNDTLFAGYTTNYNIYTGLNGIDWDYKSSGVFIDETGIAPDFIISATLNVNPLAMRYLKYEVDGGNHWSGVAEIRIYSDVSNPIPEPSTMLLLGFGLVGLAGISRKRLRL